MNYLASRRMLFPTLALAILASTVVGQSRRNRDDKENPKTLELRAQKAEQALAREYLDIASGYYDLGDVEKAKDFLVRLNDLRKGLPGVKEKINELEEELMNSNSNTLSIDTAKGWGEAIAVVREGEAFRLAAAGDYKLTTTMKVDVTGLPSRDPVKDLAGNVPFGALMGLIVGTDGKPGRPFAVKDGVEHTPRKSGQLYVRVNTPPGAKCTGKIQVRISGKVITGARKKKR